MDVSDSSKWPELSKIDPELEQHFKEHPFPAAGVGDPSHLPAIREITKARFAQLIHLDESKISKSARKIAARDGFELECVVYKPAITPAKPGPLAVLYHGGGFMVGFPEMETASATHLVEKYNAVAVSVTYRLAPENPFPTPVNDAWDVLKWCAANASSLGADPSQGFLLGGTSAGGNLSAVLEHLARDEKLSPPLTGVLLAYPTTCPVNQIPEQFKNEYQSYYSSSGIPGPLTKESLDEVFTLYIPPSTDPSEAHLYAPLMWPTGHEGLPKTHVQVCGMDPLRDDGLLYEREIRKAGTQTKLEVYPGAVHGIDWVAPEISVAKRFVKEKMAGWDWLMA